MLEIMTVLPNQTKLKKNDTMKASLPSSMHYDELSSSTYEK